MGRDLEDMDEELRTISGAISAQVRSLALGLIALVWVLTGLKDTALTIDDGARRELPNDCVDFDRSPCH